MTRLTRRTPLDPVLPFTPTADAVTPNNVTPEMQRKLGIGRAGRVKRARKQARAQRALAALATTTTTTK